jgi:hypothetical protein
MFINLFFLILFEYRDYSNFRSNRYENINLLNNSTSNRPGLDDDNNKGILK